MQPGLLEGFGSVDQQRAFDALFQNITREDFNWCCAAVGGSPEWASFPYARPRPFASEPWSLRAAALHFAGGGGRCSSWLAAISGLALASRHGSGCCLPGNPLSTTGLNPSTGGYAAWEAPTLQLPGYCDAEMDERNRGYRAFANHPCSFLRNATAAAEAAAIS